MEANDYQVGGLHYRTGIQHWDYVLANDIPYLEAMAIKYLTRWRKKDGHRDLQKSQHFMRKLFEAEGIAWDPRDEAMPAEQGDSRYAGKSQAQEVKTGAQERGGKVLKR